MDTLTNAKLKSSSTLMPGWLYNNSAGTYVTTVGTSGNGNTHYLQMYLGQVEINIANAINGGTNPIIGMQNGATAYLDLEITGAKLKRRCRLGTGRYVG